MHFTHNSSQYVFLQYCLGFSGPRSRWQHIHIFWGGGVGDDVGVGVGDDVGVGVGDDVSVVVVIGFVVGFGVFLTITFILVLVFDLIFWGLVVLVMIVALF